MFYGLMTKYDRHLTIKSCHTKKHYKNNTRKITFLEIYPFLTPWPIDIVLVFHITPPAQSGGMSLPMFLVFRNIAFNYPLYY